MWAGPDHKRTENDKGNTRSKGLESWWAPKWARMSQSEPVQGRVSQREQEPNTITDNIHVQKLCQILILFGLGNLSQYEYEYYSEWQFFPNRNTNTYLTLLECYQSTNTNHTNINKKKKTVKGQQIPKQWNFHIGSLLAQNTTEN